MSAGPTSPSARLCREADSAMPAVLLSAKRGAARASWRDTMSAQRCRRFECLHCSVVISLLSADEREYRVVIFRKPMLPRLRARDFESRQRGLCYICQTPR